MGFFSPKGYATLSPCRRYRYSLRRVWDEDKPRICFIMVNPSTADAQHNDPTIRKCMKFARRWGYGSLEVVNLFAVRATDPDRLYHEFNPIEEKRGPRFHNEFGWRGSNALAILKAVRRSKTVVAAWGVHGKLMDQDQRVCNLLKGHMVFCFGTTKHGHPRHPLFVRDDEELQPFTPRGWTAPMRCQRRVRLIEQETGDGQQMAKAGTSGRAAEADPPEGSGDRQRRRHRRLDGVGDWLHSRSGGQSGPGADREADRAGGPDLPAAHEEEVISTRTPPSPTKPVEGGGDRHGHEAEGSQGPEEAERRDQGQVTSSSGTGPGQPTGPVAFDRTPEFVKHLPGVGDKGQRYVVIARWSGITREVGYAGEGYQKFADAFLKHPSIDRVYVVDRTTTQVVYKVRR